jgi:hypothetical protein
MKKLAIVAVFAASVVAAAAVSAAVNPPVSIAYPISASSNDNYFKVSFTSTCSGGMNKIQWAFDGVVAGSATFYDNYNTQFLHKLPSGWHVLEVKATCGAEAIKFFVN